MMRSASAILSAIGFSTSTALPSSIAFSTGARCSPSLVDTMTAVTSGRAMISSLFAEANRAPTSCASFCAAPRFVSDTAMKLTAGWDEASFARSVPMRPEPTTASPICLRSMTGSLFDFQIQRLDDLAPLRGLGLDVLRELFRRIADRFRTLRDKTLSNVGQGEDAHDLPVEGSDDFFRRARGRCVTEPAGGLKPRNAGLRNRRQLG